MENRVAFEAKLKKIETRRGQPKRSREKSFIRDEAESTVFGLILDYILFGGWYVLAGFAFAALAILAFLGFIGFKVGALFAVAVALYLAFNYLSDS